MLIDSIGAEDKTETGILGKAKHSYSGKPTTSSILDTYEVTGHIANRRVVEEIEVIETHRFYEETEPLGKPLLDEEEIKRHHSKKFF